MSSPYLIYQYVWKRLLLNIEHTLRIPCKINVTKTPHLQVTTYAHLHIEYNLICHFSCSDKSERIKCFMHIMLVFHNREPAISRLSSILFHLPKLRIIAFSAIKFYLNTFHIIFQIWKIRLATNSHIIVLIWFTKQSYKINLS